MSDQSHASVALTKLVPSAKADSIRSTPAFPALPCWAFARRFAAGAWCIPPRGFNTEFRGWCGHFRRNQPHEFSVPPSKRLG